MKTESRLQIYITFKEFFIYLYRVLFNSKIDYIKKAENEIKTLTSANYCLLTSSARSAIYLMLKNGLKKNSLIAITSLTLSDVVNMILCAGHKPLFIDVNYKDGQMSLKDLEKISKKRKIDAVLVTHFFGQMCDMKNLKVFCKKNNIKIFEDAAQVFGGSQQGVHSGNFGEAGAFSFGQFKTTSCIKGGALITNNKKIYEKSIKEIKIWKKYNKFEKISLMLYVLLVKIITNKLIFNLFIFKIFKFGNIYNVSFINSFLKIEKKTCCYNILPKKFKKIQSNESAEMLINQINNAKKNINKRLLYAKIYEKNLISKKNLVLTNLKSSEDVLYVLFAKVKNRSNFIKNAYLNNFDISVCYNKNLADLNCFKMFKRECINSKKIVEEAIYLPCRDVSNRNYINRLVQFINKY